MKVVHILAGPLHSGAGRAVRALHEKFLSTGIDSHLLGRIETNLPPSMNAHPVPTWQKIPSSLRVRFYLYYYKILYGIQLTDTFSTSFGLGLHNKPIYKAADIIHIQFASASTLGKSFWRQLKNEKRPVIWTMRDMWPFTGGCHFSAECERFKQTCGNCPQIGKNVSENLTTNDIHFKSANIGTSTTFVAISNYMANLARSSSVLKKSDIRIISNAVMLDRFDNLDKVSARQALGLPLDKIILSTGALNLAEMRKGSQTLATLIEAYKERSDIHWAIFGKGLESVIETIPNNCTNFGLLEDDIILNQIYSASDLYLMPSLQESFGKTTAEASAAGTPIVAYASTSAEDIIINGESGWLVPHGDIDAYRSRVDDALILPTNKLTTMGKRASEHVHTNFSLENIAKQHIDLYTEKLENARSS